MVGLVATPCLDVVQKQPDDVDVPCFKLQTATLGQKRGIEEGQDDEEGWLIGREMVGNSFLSTCLWMTFIWLMMLQ